MSVHGAPGERVACPDCGAQVWPERERLCRNCGYPLMFLRPDKQESESYGVARAPGERTDSTAVMTPPPMRQPTRSYAAPPPQPQPFTGSAAPLAGELICPRCGHRSPPTRVRCERCGTELRGTMMMPEPAEPMPGPPGPRRSRGWLVLAGVLAGIAVLVVGTYLLVHRGNQPNPASPPPVAAPQVELIRIDAKSIRAAASSTNPNETRYKVGSTLDGKRSTAWNSNGDRLDSNVGQRLTYTFNRPVKLARVTIVNGYTRTPTLFKGNERVAKMTIQTDAGQARWDLDDSDQPQSLDVKPEATKKVVLVVDAVYDGNKYKDVCVTEVTFYEVP